jgi:hypothetical protein
VTAAAFESRVGKEQRKPGAEAWSWNPKRKGLASGESFSCFPLQCEEGKEPVQEKSVGMGVLRSWGALFAGPEEQAQPNLSDAHADADAIREPMLVA